MSTIASQPAKRPARRGIHYADFLLTDFADPHVEWVDGEIIQMAPSSGDHSDLDLSLAGWVKGFVEHHDLGVVRREPFQMKTGPVLPGRAPDMIFVATANLKRLKKNHLQGPADLAVEIISPESRGRDRGDKFYEYEKGGVKEYWIIDPERKEADFYLRNRAGLFKPVALDAGGVFCSIVLPGLWLKTDWLWKKPLPSIASVLKWWNVV